MRHQCLIKCLWVNELDFLADSDDSDEGSMDEDEDESKDSGSEDAEDGEEGEMESEGGSEGGGSISLADLLDAAKKQKILVGTRE